MTPAPAPMDAPRLTGTVVMGIALLLAIRGYAAYTVFNIPSFGWESPGYLQVVLAMSLGFLLILAMALGMGLARYAALAFLALEVAGWLAFMEHRWEIRMLGLFSSAAVQAVALAMLASPGANRWYRARRAANREQGWYRVAQGFAWLCVLPLALVVAWMQVSFSAPHLLEPIRALLPPLR